MKNMTNSYRTLVFGFATTLSLYSVTAHAQATDQQAQKFDPSMHISAASMVPGVARHPAGVEIKESPNYHAPISNNDATLDLDNHRLSDNGPQAASPALTPKQDIIAAPVLGPLTMYDLNARLQTAQATYAGANLAYKQASREGDNARMAAQQQLMATSQTQINGINSQIKAYQAAQAPVAKKKRKVSN